MRVPIRAEGPSAKPRFVFSRNSLRAGSAHMQSPCPQTGQTGEAGPPQAVEGARTLGEEKHPSPSILFFWTGPLHRLRRSLPRFTSFAGEESLGDVGLSAERLVRLLC